MVGVPDRRTHKELVLMSRPLAVLASLILTISGLVVVLPDRASACTCALEGGSREEIVEGALSDSEAVFSGEVVAVEQGKSNSPIPVNDTVTLRTAEVWKGTGRGTVEVSTPSQVGACGNHFEVGRGYLVYAYGKRGLNTDICTETKPLEKADADLAVLGDGERPQDGEVLSDTSGGVSVMAMAGLAGLALAASVLLVVRLVRTG
jgi:hypothetical protein